MLISERWLSNIESRFGPSPGQIRHASSQHGCPPQPRFGGLVLEQRPEAAPAQQRERGSLFFVRGVGARRGSRKRSRSPGEESPGSGRTWSHRPRIGARLFAPCAFRCGRAGFGCPERVRSTGRAGGPDPLGTAKLGYATSNNVGFTVAVVRAPTEDEGQGATRAVWLAQAGSLFQIGALWGRFRSWRPTSGLRDFPAPLVDLMRAPLWS